MEIINEVIVWVGKRLRKEQQMELKQFVEDFNLNTIIRIIQKNEVLYEGKIDILVKLLNCKVLKKSGNWKARQGGQGLEISNTSIIKFEPCATEAMLAKLFYLFGSGRSKEDIKSALGRSMRGEITVI